MKERIINISKAMVTFILSTILVLGGFLLFLAIIPAKAANVISFTIIVFLTIIVSYLLYRKKKKINYTHLLTSIFLLVLITFLAHGFSMPKENFAKRESMKTWELSTGSKLGYWEFKPVNGADMNETPLIFLHGGPGGTLRSYEKTFLQKLANQGHHVYAYEQEGAGNSYNAGIGYNNLTLDRHIKDLNEIQTKKLKKDKINLMGQSNGSTLSVRYLTEYPGKVEKFIASEPGNFDADLSDNKSSKDPGKENASEEYNKRYTDTPSIFEGINDIGNILSLNLVGKPIKSESQFLVDSLGTAESIIASSFPKDDWNNIPDYKTSDQSSNFLPFNMLSNVNFNNEFFKENKKLTESVKSFKGKVMVALGEYSYVDRGESREFFEKFSNTTNKYYENVGHVIWGKNDSTADKFATDVDDFLRNKHVESDFSDYQSLKKLDAA